MLLIFTWLFIYFYWNYKTTCIQSVHFCIHWCQRFVHAIFMDNSYLSLINFISPWVWRFAISTKIVNSTSYCVLWWLSWRSMQKKHVCLNSKVKQGPWSLPLENSWQQNWSFYCCPINVFFGCIMHIRLCNQFTCENFKGKGSEMCKWKYSLWAREKLFSKYLSMNYKRGKMWLTFRYYSDLVNISWCSNAGWIWQHWVLDINNNIFMILPPSRPPQWPLWSKQRHWTLGSEPNGSAWRSCSNPGTSCDQVALECLQDPVGWCGLSDCHRSQSSLPYLHGHSPGWQWLDKAQQKDGTVSIYPNSSSQLLCHRQWRELG